MVKVMTEDKEYQKLDNYLDLAIENQMLVITDEFYTPNLWKKLLKNSYRKLGISINTNGVFIESDRRQIAFVPNSYYNYKQEINYPNKLLRIEVNKRFNNYEHKDFLGSLMGLSLKRELFGDLILIENVAYIPVSDKIVEYVLLNLNKIGKSTCTIKIMENDESIPQYRFDDKVIVISSKRLDSIVSGITNLSRMKVIEPIENGKVLIDYVEEKDKSKKIEIGSTITIKGFGKFKLFAENGETKKGKEKILVKKYK